MDDAVEIVLAATKDATVEELEHTATFIRWIKGVIRVYTGFSGRTVAEALADRSLYDFVDAAMKPLVAQGEMPEMLFGGLTTTQFAHNLLDGLAMAISTDGRSRLQ